MLKIAIPVLTLVAIIVIVAMHNSGNTINLGDYVLVSVEGLNERAEGKAVFDEVALSEKLRGAYKDNEKDEECDRFIKSVNCNISKISALKNGDEIKIYTSCNENLLKELGFELTKEERSYTVKGLEDGVLLDAFKDLSVITVGTSPYIFATYSNNASNEYLKGLEYKFSKTTGIAAGDTIKITLVYDAKSAAKAGYYFEKTDMDYLVSEVDRYVTNCDMLDMDTISAKDADFLNVINTAVADMTTRMTYILTDDNQYLYRDNNEKAENFAYDRTVLLVNNTGHETEIENEIVVIYHGQVGLATYKPENPYEYIDAWFGFTFTNATVNKEGRMVLSMDNIEKRYICASSYEALLNKINESAGVGFDIKSTKQDG